MSKNVVGHLSLISKCIAFFKMVTKSNPIIIIQQFNFRRQYLTKPVLTSKGREDFKETQDNGNSLEVWYGLSGHHHKKRIISLYCIDVSLVAILETRYHISDQNLLLLLKDVMKVQIRKIWNSSFQHHRLFNNSFCSQLKYIVLYLLIANWFYHLYIVMK